MKITKTELKQMITEAVHQALKESSKRGRIDVDRDYKSKKIGLKESVLTDLKTEVDKLLPKEFASFVDYENIDLNGTSADFVSDKTGEVLDTANVIKSTNSAVTILPIDLYKYILDEYAYAGSIEDAFNEALAYGEIDGDPNCFCAYTNLGKTIEFVSYTGYPVGWNTVYEVEKTYNSVRELARAIVGKWNGRKH